MFDFTQRVASRLRRPVTPQRDPVPNSNERPNSANGYTWLIDDWFRLDRLLTLGSDRPLTHENAKALTALLATDGPRVVERVMEISASGAAPKNDAALFVLAMAAGSDDDATRTAALEALRALAQLEDD